MVVLKANSTASNHTATFAKSGISHNVPFVSKHRIKVRAQPILSSFCPKLLLKQLFAISDFDGQIPSRPRISDFREPNEVQQASYDVITIKAIKDCNLDQLRRLQNAGKNFNACSQFGESLLHMACRRGKVAVVRFLLQEAHVRANVRCDRGRTVFHDACWSLTPNHSLMDVLIRHAPLEFLLAEDCQGNTPFDYAPRRHWGDWVKYLHKNKENLLERLKAKMEINTNSLKGLKL